MAGTLLSLFAGAGGMDLGLESAGFESLGAIEIGETQRNTLKRNRPWPLLGGGDINELAEQISPEDFGMQPGELDLMAGGPPCQPFSMAAQWAKNGRRGLADPRARTVTSTLKLVERFLPKALLIENVRGFLSGPNSAADFLTSELQQIGHRHGVQYTAHTQVLNAADYGVPQNRRRAIVVVLRDAPAFEWPTPGFKSAPRTAWDALHDVHSDVLPKAKGKWAELLPNIPPGWNYQWLTDKGGGAELFGSRTKYWNFLLKLDPNRPSWTLAASPGPATGPFHWDNRPLSVPEQLRLQSFPDDWQVAGDYREQTLQIGNATPPALAEALGNSLHDALFQSGRKDQRLAVGAATAPAPLLAVSRRVPATYAPLIGRHASHAGAGLGPASRVAG